MIDDHKKILDTVDANKDKAIKFLQDIVAIPSVTGDEGKIQVFLNAYLKKIGLDVDMWESLGRVEKASRLHTSCAGLRRSPQYCSHVER